MTTNSFPLGIFSQAFPHLRDGSQPKGNTVCEVCDMQLFPSSLHCIYVVFLTIVLGPPVHYRKYDLHLPI